MSKVFIVGLPRTGTTSLCKACIDLGFSTAHTAYTVETIVNAEVVADTPVFNDYMLLHRKYPDARFIYLERPLAVWLPSISRLLSRMADNLFSEHGGFNDTIKRCFFNTFQGLTTDKIDDFEFLETCYQQHRRQALHYFQQNKTNYICLDIADADCHDLLCQFLNVPLQHRRMPRLNVNGKVTAWNDLKHPLKVSSTRRGKTAKDSELLAFIQDATWNSVENTKQTMTTD